MTKLIRLAFEGMDGTVRLAPPMYTDNKTGEDPGDLSKFAPHGNGVYGYQGGIDNPFLQAPPQGDIGGFLYFGNSILCEEFDALMSITDVCSKYVRERGNPLRDYAVFYKESKDPGRDGYLSQMRIVSRFALKYLFGSISEADYDSFEEQELPINDAIWGFMQNERKRYGTMFGNPDIAGKAGGDGHFAQEELGFGFMVENSYHNVYRIWSRAHLVTK